jgi:oxygen-independent coproporphyrinogen-3 oxidase
VNRTTSNDLASANEAANPVLETGPQFMDLQRLQELIARYDAAGPRYTSYPTAPVWGEDVGPQDYRDALSALSDDDERGVSLYVHVPFCKSLCHYCACNKIITQKEELPTAFLETLAREIAATRDALQDPLPAAHVHLGGGTPTHLSPGQLTQLMAMIDDAFPIQSDAELSIEVDPRVTHADHIDALQACHFNRISLGVQDFDERVQQAVRRVQSVDQVAELSQRARSSGFAGVNFDLIYGLPFQTEASFDRTIDQVLEISPDRVALYSYAHVTWVAKQQRGFERIDLPDSDLKLRIMMLAIRRFLDAGYVYIGMDHFAKPDDELARAHTTGSLHRNFMGYTTRNTADLLAFGPSGIGELESGYVQSRRGLAEWHESVAQDGMATFRGHWLTGEDRRRAWVIKRIMCRDGVSAKDYDATFDESFVEHFAPELASLCPMVDDGIVSRTPDGGFAITSLGRLLVRNVAMLFDAYLPAQQRKGQRLFSKTI